MVNGLLDNVTQRAIRLAGQRWPEADRHDAVAEWTAELHMLGDDRWRAFRYAASLALARSDREIGTARSSPGRRVRGTAFLALTPLVAGVFAYGLWIVIVVVTQSVLGLESAVWCISVSHLLVAVPLVFVGRRTGRDLGEMRHAPTWTALTLVVGVLSACAVLRLVLTSNELRPLGLELAALAWSAVFWLTGWAILALRHMGQDALAGAVCVAGGVAAWFVGVIVAGLLQTGGSDLSRAYVLLWPIALLVNIPGLSTAVPDDLIFLPFSLIPATVFGLACLTGAKGETPSIEQVAR